MYALVLALSLGLTPDEEAARAAVAVELARLSPKKAESDPFTQKPVVKDAYADAYARVLRLKEGEWLNIIIGGKDPGFKDDGKPFAIVYIPTAPVPPGDYRWWLENGEVVMKSEKQLFEDQFGPQVWNDPPKYKITPVVKQSLTTQKEASRPASPFVRRPATTPAINVRTVTYPNTSLPGETPTGRTYILAPGAVRRGGTSTSGCSASG